LFINFFLAIFVNKLLFLFMEIHTSTCNVYFRFKNIYLMLIFENRAQVVGWPPIRNSRKNIMATNNNQSKNKEDVEGKQGSGCLYVKVSMDGAPYLRKVDLKTYSNYKELSTALEKMFSCFTIGELCLRSILFMLSLYPICDLFGQLKMF